LWKRRMGVMNIGVAPQETFWAKVKLALVSDPGWGNSKGCRGQTTTRLLARLTTYAFDHLIHFEDLIVMDIAPFGN
jgi:hypothetical protein